MASALRVVNDASSIDGDRSSRLLDEAKVDVPGLYRGADNEYLLVVTSKLAFRYRCAASGGVEQD
jgi:hypothetical protein